MHTNGQDQKLNTNRIGNIVNEDKMFSCACAKLIKHHAMKTHERRHSSTILDLSTRSNGPLQAATALPPVPIGQEVRWVPESIRTLWSRDKFLALARIELRSLSP
jgi:hypothetical protein